MRARAPAPRSRAETVPIPHPGLLVVSLCAAFVALPVSGTAQQRFSPAFIEQDHWSIEAARRLAALGLAPAGHDPARRVLTQDELARLFVHAVDAAPAGSETGALAAGFLTRYAAELAIPDGTGVRSAFTGSDVVGGYGLQRGRHRTGHGYEEGHPLGDWEPAQSEPDWDGVLARAGAQVTLAERFALRADVEHGEEGVRFREIVLGADAGPVVLWAGRRRYAWKPGTDAGIVLSHGVFDGAGVQTDAAFRLPWVLRHLGDIQLELAVGQHDFRNPCVDRTLGAADSVPCENAWFLATRGSLSPHPRVALGVSRAAFFGGEGNTDVDAFAVFSVLIGKHAGEVSELDNQLVAVDAGWRPPTESWLPLRLYAEWGFEDSAGAFANVPGILAGIEVPSVPGVPGLGISVERTSFARSCCDNPIWYRHSVYHDGWTQDGRPLGHPLAGHGSEWSLGATGTFREARVTVDGRAFARDRGTENLYDPERLGESLGTTARVTLLLARGIEAQVGGSIEYGRGWREHAVAVGLRAFPMTTMSNGR